MQTFLTLPFLSSVQENMQIIPIVKVEIWKHSKWRTAHKPEQDETTVN